jgi:hypothetical protein
MAEVGILIETDRVELIEGEIIEMSPLGLRHSLSVAALNNSLARGIGDRAVMWSANPVRLFPHTEPQPDIVFVRAPLSRYAQHPGPADILFLIEVSDTSYRFDRHVKLPLYARALRARRHRGAARVSRRRPRGDGDPPGPGLVAGASQRVDQLSVCCYCPACGGGSVANAGRRSSVMHVTSRSRADAFDKNSATRFCMQP